MFVSGLQSVFGWHNAEYVIGWKRVMQMILCIFKENERMGDIMTTLHKLLKESVKENWMGRGKEITVDLKITEEDFPPEDIKLVKIQFLDDLQHCSDFTLRIRRQLSRQL